MNKVSQILLEHADNLESGRLEWVRDRPGVGQACVGWVGTYSGNVRRLGVWAEGLDEGWETVDLALAKEVRRRLNLSASAATFVAWNDHHCHGVFEAVDFLRSAAKHWEEDYG